MFGSKFYFKPLKSIFISMTFVVGTAFIFSASAGKSKTGGMKTPPVSYLENHDPQITLKTEEQMRKKCNKLLAELILCQEKADDILDTLNTILLYKDLMLSDLSSVICSYNRVITVITPENSLTDVRDYCKKRHAFVDDFKKYSSMLSKLIGSLKIISTDIDSLNQSIEPIINQRRKLTESSTANLPRIHNRLKRIFQKESSVLNKRTSITEKFTKCHKLACNMKLPERVIPIYSMEHFLNIYCTQRNSDDPPKKDIIILKDDTLSPNILSVSHRIFLKYLKNDDK